MSLVFKRGVSSSPYGRTHVWKRRKPTLPNPVVPLFPQKVVLSDGSSFTHYISSPRSFIRLTRDTTNHPLWNTNAQRTKGGSPLGIDGEEPSARLERYRKRFKGIGGTTGKAERAVNVARGAETQQTALPKNMAAAMSPGSKT